MSIRPGLSRLATRLAATAAAMASMTALGIGAGSSMAQTMTSVPAGCTTQVVMQRQSCESMVIFACEADDPPLTRRMNVSHNGIEFLAASDATLQFTEFLTLPDGRLETLAGPPLDPVDTDVLASFGMDTHVYDMVVRGTGETVTYSGVAWLTGTETVIDGVPLLETELLERRSAADGTVLRETASVVWFDPARALFYADRVWRPAYPDDVATKTPVAFDLPGEPGFTDFTPRFGC